MERFLWVCFGGAIGSGARYAVSAWAIERFGAGFAWGTFAVNVVGSFFIAFVLQLSATTDWIAPTVRLTLTTGVLGGFTTYSAFNQDVLGSAQRGEWALAWSYLLATVFVCLLAGILGHYTARAIAGG